ncbi:PTS sugar transporter subunit IIA [Listeria sp. SHR_NRA_18]|uniref:PTS sugar transporter subunit IIA n=1 Tax=Listeria sp. SHR_NRA_18 TaxID=2269046 RepID=UPI00051CD2CF|nr:PTS sugar transporter subunit IIA [Listeria sp. SHR_NRA_18]KGL46514.1 PTS galactitol transporter subunit IIA [Listeriaceae bacterium FSL A5-0209]RQW66775.1 PTS sugar transporter subunit IIA [Listeria sp. SHR_NRA_18]
MDFDDLFQEDFTLMGGEFESREELFTEVATILEQKDYVTPSFCEAIIEREKVFPTGLEMNGIVIAIPHTDTVHVKRPFVFVSQLRKPLDFIQMGTTDKGIAVEMVFVLGICDPASQVPLLASIMERFTQAQFIAGLREKQSKEALIDFLKLQFGRMMKG